MSVFYRLLLACSKKIVFVYTSMATNVTDKTVTFNGGWSYSRYTSDLKILHRFQYREKGSTDWIQCGASPEITSGNQAFYEDMTGLKPNTTYEFRAKVDGENYDPGSFPAYGEIMTFTTQQEIIKDYYPQHLLDKIYFMLDGTFQTSPRSAWNDRSVFLSDPNMFKQTGNRGYVFNTYNKENQQQIVSHLPPNESYTYQLETPEPFRGTNYLRLGQFEYNHGRPYVNNLNREIFREKYTIYANVRFSRYPPISTASYCILSFPEMAPLGSTFSFVFGLAVGGRLLFGGIESNSETTPMAEINLVNDWDDTKFHNIIMRRFDDGFGELIIDNQPIKQIHFGSIDTDGYLCFNNTCYASSPSPMTSEVTYGNTIIFDDLIEDHDLAELIKLDLRRFPLDDFNMNNGHIEIL